MDKQFSGMTLKVSQTQSNVVSSRIRRPDSLVDTVVEILRKRILSGGFQEGELLNQVALAREYGISRIPLREACRQLEVQGLLVSEPGKGTLVSSLSVREIEEVIDLRATIEPDLMVKAIDNFTASDLEYSADLLSQFERALEQAEIQSWGEWNWKFHLSLYRPSGSELAIGIVENLHNINQRYARMQISLTKWELRAKREHRLLLSLARRRDKKRAYEVLEQHIRSAGEALIQLIRSERGSLSGGSVENIKTKKERPINTSYKAE